MTIAALWNSEGQFSGNSAQKDHWEHWKHSDDGVGLMVANHRDGGEILLVVTSYNTINYALCNSLLHRFS